MPNRMYSRVTSRGSGWARRATRWAKGHRAAVVLGGVAALGLAGLAAFLLADGFDDIEAVTVAGGGPEVVRVALVDRAVGFDVTPDVLDVRPGTHVVLDVVNEAGGAHDLAVEGGPRTAVLGPGESERLDLGRVTGDLTGRCTIGDHDIAGMTVELDVA